MPLPDPNSLNHLVTRQAAVDEALAVRATLQTFYNAVDNGTDLRYDIMREDAGSKTKKILNLIFAEDPASAAIRAGVLGQMTRGEFKERFASAGRIYEEKMIPTLGETFTMKSFPETYFHPHIARALCATGLLTNPARVQARVEETSLVMLDTLERKYGLAVMLGIAKSHERRNPELHTPETVEYTLLTFSYYGAKAAKITAADWFFYWKVFGSLLGLPLERLHATLEGARARMQEIHRTSCPVPPTEDSRRLLDTFIDCYLDSADEIREANGKDLISKRMRLYLQSRGRWPHGLA